MKNKKNPFIKVGVEFLILVVGLGFCALFLQHKITNLLNKTIEQVVAAQTSDMAEIAEQQFQRELKAMRYVADYIADHPAQASEAVAKMEQEMTGDSLGVLDVDMQHIAGGIINKESFRRLPMAALGNEIIDYANGDGLLLAVPIKRGTNATGVLWRRFNEETARKVFGLSKYGSDRHFVITAHNGQTIFPYREGNGLEVLADASMQEKLILLSKKMETRPAAALFADGRYGRFFIFGADLPSTNCSLVGFVPWEAVAGGIARIYMLVLRAGSVLLALVAIISVCFFVVQTKAEESESLKKEKEYSDRASQAKSAFLANMSHEIRTPINAILGMNEMLLREVKNPTAREYAQSIARAGEALLSIINDILDFSKIESGKLEIIESEYHLSHLLKNIVAMIQPKADAKGLSFNLHIDEDLPDELMGDMMRIQQVVINILNNAVKYTPSGEVNFYVFKEHLDGSRIYLSFVVNDTGIGIKEADQAKLFHDFERLDQEKNRNIEGTGLGLAITKMLLDLMGGSIELKSIYGEGSTFTIVLPQTIMDDSPIGNLAEKMTNVDPAPVERYAPSFTAPEARILVVDDNEMNLLVVTGLLKETQIDIDTCLSGFECLDKLNEKEYDLVLLDHMMPEMDGVETLHKAEVLPNANGVPFIMLTANAISGAKDAFLKEGFAAYLSKPIDSELLEETLLKFLPPRKIRSVAKPAEEPLWINLEALRAQFERDKAKAEGAEEKAEVFENSSLAEFDSSDFDPEQGLKYNGGMEDMYKTVLEMYVNLRPEKQAKMKEHFEAEDWKNYATMLHALKSTSLTIGGQKCSEAARALEFAGKKTFNTNATDAEKAEAAQYIKEHHAAAMTLYDRLAAAASDWLFKH